MACASFLYFSRNSSAPEKAIWLMYFNLGSRHTNSTVGNCKRTFLLIYRNAHSQVAQFTFKFANRSQCFQFWVASTAFDTNSRKNLVIAVQKFLDNGKILSLVTPMFPFAIVRYIFYWLIWIVILRCFPFANKMPSEILVTEWQFQAFSAVVLSSNLSHKNIQFSKLVSCNFKISGICRLWFSGKKLQNGVPFWISGDNSYLIKTAILRRFSIFDYLCSPKKFINHFV